MFKQLKKQAEGFTIIEVLIVLAIAGLIMLVVFLAVPALQRNSRNTQRKADASALLGAMSEKISNNNGQIPATCNGTTANCFVKDAKLSYYDNTTANVSFTKQTTINAPVSLNPSTAADRDKIVGFSGTKCNTDGTFRADTATLRSIAFQFMVETSSGFQLQCTES